MDTQSTNHTTPTQTGKKVGKVLHKKYYSINQLRVHKVVQTHSYFENFKPNSMIYQLTTASSFTLK